MYNRANKTIKLVRQQITENQHAPFLADLYLQLGELLAQKANIVYYIKMESNEQSSETITTSLNNFKEVVSNQKEAIAIFNRLLDEFPHFDKKGKVLYLLATSYKSIDEIPAFISTTKKLLDEYAKTKEAARAQLLLGQYFFEKKMYNEAEKNLEPVLKSEFVHEKNLARYHTGIIHTIFERNKQALECFEKIITDVELKDSQSSFEISLKSKSVKSNLKREALIDSIKPFTSLYQKDADPVGYYSKIAPTEILFQETIEKLAYRYIYLKQFQFAIKLLRTLSERTVNVQQVINIYQEVLLMIPVKERIDLPVEEIQFLLERYNSWINYYKVPPQFTKQSYVFFEKQVRDLGTRAHDFSKQMFHSLKPSPSKTDKNKNLQEKMQYYAQKSIHYYHLYLAYFKGSGNAVKIAMNLADVYFQQEDYINSGDFYLRTYADEFGKTTKQQKIELIKNSLYCLQKEKDYSFYELLRGKGLLIEVLTIYINSDTKLKSDPKLNFILAKSRYEQGFYDIAIEELYTFIKKFKDSKYAMDAANLILDYFNTKNDFPQLVQACERLLTLKLNNRPFNQKVAGIKKQAQMNQLQSQVEAFDDYDSFSQGKTYLKAALSSGDVKLMSLALQNALAQSKKEKDIDTFFKTASVLANSEKTPSKRFNILGSMAQENVRITRYYAAMEIYQTLASNQQNQEANRSSAYTDSLNIATALRDWEKIHTLSESPFWQKVPAATKDRLRNQLIDILESPISLSDDMQNMLTRVGLTDEIVLAMYKASNRLNNSYISLMQKEVGRKCSRQKGLPVCHWKKVEQLDKEVEVFEEQLQKSKLDLKAVELNATHFQKILKEFTQASNSSDPHLEILVSLRSAYLYNLLSKFLTRVAVANPPLKDVLASKALDSSKTAAQYLSRCKKIIEVQSILTPANKYCFKGQNPSLENALNYNNVNEYPEFEKINEENDYLNDQKNLFSSTNGDEALLNIATKYYTDGKINYALAAAESGASMGGKSVPLFNAIIGCSVVNLGHHNEAKYYLKNASDYKGLKSKCLSKLKSMEKDIL